MTNDLVVKSQRNAKAWNIMDNGHEIDDHRLYCLVLFGLSILGDELW
jgi:hypothetical protein